MKTLKDIYTGNIYANQEVLDAAPRNKTQGALEFFNLGRYVTNDELEKEYESRGLIPADIYALAAWCEENKDDPRKYFATHWKDKDGKWCYAAFSRWGVVRSVSCDRDDGGWGDDWFLSGVPALRKSSKLKSSALHSDTLSLEARVKAIEDTLGYHNLGRP